MSSSQGVRAKPIAPTKSVMASIDRRTMSLRLKRSPIEPHTGPMTAAARGAAPKVMPDQRWTAARSWTPSSSRKLGKNGRKLIMPRATMRFAA